MKKITAAEFDRKFDKRARISPATSIGHRAAGPTSSPSASMSISRTGWCPGSIRKPTVWVSRVRRSSKIWIADSAQRGLSARALPWR